MKLFIVICAIQIAASQTLWTRGSESKTLNSPDIHDQPIREGTPPSRRRRKDDLPTRGSSTSLSSYIEAPSNGQAQPQISSLQRQRAIIEHQRAIERDPPFTLNSIKSERKLDPGKALLAAASGTKVGSNLAEKHLELIKAGNQWTQRYGAYRQRVQAQLNSLEADGPIRPLPPTDLAERAKVGKVYQKAGNGLLVAQKDLVQAFKDDKKIKLHKGLALVHAMKANNHVDSTHSTAADWHSHQAATTGHGPSLMKTRNKA